MLPYLLPPPISLSFHLSPISMCDADRGSVPAMSTAKDKMLRVDRRTAALPRLHKSKLGMPIRQPHLHLAAPSLIPTATRLPRRLSRRVPTVVPDTAVPLCSHIRPPIRGRPSSNASLPPLRSSSATTESVWHVAAIHVGAVMDAESSGRKLCRDRVPSSPRSADSARNGFSGARRE
jgi:hypothetical protein